MKTQISHPVFTNLAMGHNRIDHVDNISVSNLPRVKVVRKVNNVPRFKLNWK